METNNLNDRLLATIANIEERTDGELIALVRETLTRVGTGAPIDDVNDQYKIIYRELDERFRKQGVEHINQFDDLWEFYSYWKENNLNTYAARRAYVRSLYRQDASSDPLWVGIHPVIRDVAKSRFDSGHRADAVEAAFKEINSRVKEYVRQKTGEELDGASLMTHAFSPSKPIIILDDLDTEDGRNIQQGYMQMFAGAMIGIRNPKAHANTEIDKDEAVSLIHFASTLFAKFLLATQNIEPIQEEAKDNKSRGLFVRLFNPDDHDLLLTLKTTVLNHPGKEPVILVLGTKERTAIRLPMKVKFSDELTRELSKVFGDENVVIRS